MSGSGLGQLITFYWLVTCELCDRASGWAPCGVVLIAQVLMTVISDKLSNTRMGECFMTMRPFIIISLSNPIGISFKLHSQDIWRFVIVTFGLGDGEWREARGGGRQTDVSLSPGCSQSTSHSRHGPFDAETVICMTCHHDIMTRVTFPLVYCDTWHMWCQVTWRDLCPHDTQPPGKCHRPFVKHKTFQ